MLIVFEKVLNLGLGDEISNETINEYVKVISDYNVREEIRNLNEIMRKEPDEMEKAKIAEKIRLLRIGEWILC